MIQKIEYPVAKDLGEYGRDWHDAEGVYQWDVILTRGPATTDPIPENEIEKP